MATEIEAEQFLCPTFTSYTADKSAETAARVATSSSYLDEDDLNFEFGLFQTDHSLDDVALSKNCHVYPIFNHKDLDLCHVDGGDSSTSSSDGEESYCVWRPKKSHSSGAGSKPWKILDLLLKRSNSEGKGDFVFLTSKGKKKTKVSAKVSAVEEFYVRSRASKEGQKRESFLPYKKDLVGFFAARS